MTDADRAPGCARNLLPLLASLHKNQHQNQPPAHLLLVSSSICLRARNAVPAAYTAVPAMSSGGGGSRQPNPPPLYSGGPGDLFLPPC
eukprot:2552282-Rhodomonas_salina.1